MPSKNRLTDQAIANVKAATRAQLEEVASGWQVCLASEAASIRLADKHNRPVIYTSKDAAKRSLARHNEAIHISFKPQI